MANIKIGVENGYKAKYGKFEKTMAKISDKLHLKQKQKSCKICELG